MAGEASPGADTTLSSANPHQEVNSRDPEAEVNPDTQSSVSVTLLLCCSQCLAEVTVDH